MYSILLVLISGTLATPLASPTVIRVNATVCTAAKTMTSWRFVRSGNYVDGVPDRRAMVELRFEGVRVGDKRVTTTARTMVKGLLWDPEFEAVYYTPQDGSAAVLCAKTNIWGWAVATDNCAVGMARTRFYDNYDPECDTDFYAEFRGLLAIGEDAAVRVAAGSLSDPDGD